MSETHHCADFITMIGGNHGTVAGLLVNRLSYWSFTRGMIHIKLHLISPGCPKPSISLQMQNRGLKHHLFPWSVIIRNADIVPDFSFIGTHYCPSYQYQKESGSVSMEELENSKYNRKFEVNRIANTKHGTSRLVCSITSKSGDNTNPSIKSSWPRRDTRRKIR